MIVDWQSSSPFLCRVLATLSLNNMIDKNIDQPGTAIDEALWTAYRRDDKAAVMDYLFHKNRVGINYSRSFPQLVIQGGVKKSRAAKRARSERMPINSAARQISLRSALN